MQTATLRTGDQHVRNAGDDADCRHITELSLAAEILCSFRKIQMVAFGSSMLPSIRPGDLLFVERTAAGDVRCGDVVLYARDDRFVAHRVVREENHRGQRLLITQGDALPFEDARPIAESDLLGRVSTIMRRGQPLQPEPVRGVAYSALAFILRRSERATTLFLQCVAASGRAARLIRRFLHAPHAAPTLDFDSGDAC